MTEAPWAEGDIVALKRRGVPPRLVPLAAGPQSLGEEGVLDLSGAIGVAPGGHVQWLGSEYRLLRPSLNDLLTAARRGAQIITSKDAAQLLQLASVGPGSRVAEAGAGSGAMTLQLAFAVGDTGHVTSYDRRSDFLETARSNVARAGLLERVTFRVRDVNRDGFDVNELDSVILDLPEPWGVLPAARSALRVGGYVATYTPTYNQLERTILALREHGFDEVRAVELLERALHVAESGTRPEFEMLGHTGFLGVGRKVD